MCAYVRVCVSACVCVCLRARLTPVAGEARLSVTNPTALTSASVPAGPTASISLQQIQVLAQGILAAGIVNDLFTV